MAIVFSSTTRTGPHNELHCVPQNIYLLFFG